VIQTNVCHTANGDPLHGAEIRRRMEVTQKHKRTWAIRHSFCPLDKPITGNNQEKLVKSPGHRRKDLRRDHGLLIPEP